MLFVLWSRCSFPPECSGAPRFLNARDDSADKLAISLNLTYSKRETRREMGPVCRKRRVAINWVVILGILKHARPVLAKVSVKAGHSLARPQADDFGWVIAIPSEDHFNPKRNDQRLYVADNGSGPRIGSGALQSFYSDCLLNPFGNGVWCFLGWVAAGCDRP